MLEKSLHSNRGGGAMRCGVGGPGSILEKSLHSN